mmetsp:Transcript_15318/g.20213  ORF Transcript_15318/g.20213 Transcript_15318/m.20213 type:complete len:266 (+) Transcript_15318:213-1010(+)
MFFVCLVDMFLICLIKIFSQNNITVLPNRLKPSFLAYCCNVCRTDLFWSIHIIFQVQIFAQVHLRSTCLEDQTLLSAIRIWEFNLSVKATRAQKSGIQRVRPVGSHDHLDVRCLVKSIHLIQQFQQDTLNLSICTSLGIKTLGGDRINLIDEHDGRGVLPSKSEHIPHHPGPFPKVFLHKLGPHHTDERCSGGICNSLGNHCLSCSRRTVEQHPSGWVDPNLLVQLEVGEWELHSFSQLLLLHVQPPNLLVGHVRFFSHQLNGAV